MFCGIALLVKKVLRVDSSFENSSDLCQIKISKRCSFSLKYGMGRTFSCVISAQISHQKLDLTDIIKREKSAGQ
ncbi:hypothetical protein T4D_3216 [Trichinella pseudospiralis]|uniref:Uncharacterized protein n=1 Tax=Trichinella pseudospiralis TaxID=6337 RepID=A0A0V1FJB5_TRIPS|nr:hypothetical protein T4D_3216 [Trichinella pseudospiralis]